MHIVMSPLEFMQRLAALVPRPTSSPRPSQAARAAGRCASVGPGCSNARVLEIDLELCPNCGGDRRLLDGELIRLGVCIGSISPFRLDVSNDRDLGAAYFRPTSIADPFVAEALVERWVVIACGRP
jgi:hypothetical protein